jgi:hypothetical protein
LTPYCTAINIELTSVLRVVRVNGEGLDRVKSNDVAASRIS